MFIGLLKGAGPRRTGRVRVDGLAIHYSVSTKQCGQRGSLQNWVVSIRIFPTRSFLVKRVALEEVHLPKRYSLARTPGLSAVAHENLKY